MRECNTIVNGTPALFPSPIRRRSLFGLIRLPFARRPPARSAPPPPFPVPTLEPPDPLAVLAARYAGLLERVEEVDDEYERLFPPRPGYDGRAAWNFQRQHIEPLCVVTRAAELALWVAMEKAGVPLFVTAGRLFVGPLAVGQSQQSFSPNWLTVFGVASLGGKGGGR